MHITLAEKLIARGVLNSTTEVVAQYKTPGIGGMQMVTAKGIFLINKIRPEAGKILLDMISVRDGTSRTVPVENVLEIDGMDPVRFASVYNIRADGGEAAQGKRRGRKPKLRITQE